MARILLSAYACEPGRGSEPGVGWSWATELTRLGHAVTVITRSANRSAIEQYAQRSPAILRFIYYDLPARIQRCRGCSGGKALYYILWQWFAVRRIQQLFPTLPFDVVHHVTYASVRYPSFMGSLGIPFWFGPVSGGEGVPPRLRAGFSAGQTCRELLRDLSNLLLPWDPLMRLTFRQAERIFVTRDTVKLVPGRCRHKSSASLAIGLPQSVPVTRQSSSKNAHGLRLLYVGRLLEWKGVDIALRAVARLRESHPNARLTIAGAGPAKAKLVGLTRDLSLGDHVHWVGWVPQKQLTTHYRTTDILLFPSLRDSGGMVVLEALAHGIPVLCADLGGPGLIVDATCGEAIATLGRSSDQIASEMADQLLRIATTPGLLASLRHGASVRARQFEFCDLVRSIYRDTPEKVACPA